MRCIYLDKRDFLSEEDMRIHTACVCMNKESDKYKTFSIEIDRLAQWRKWIKR